jgi:nicotinamidase/pyrazinamidase
MTSKPDLRDGDALLVVDVQNDFCPGGALPVPDGDDVVPVLNRWMAAAEQASVPIFASRDWHPRSHPSFAPFGGPWPVHCVQDSEGAAFHGNLNLPPTAVVVSKGTRFDKDQYSAFDETGLAEALARENVRRVVIGGLAEDVCVRATALDARKAGLETLVLREATRAISEEGRDRTEAELAEAGVSLV